MKKSVKIIRGDCLKALRKMPDDSADCVITSPPYNMNLRIRNGKYCSRQITKELTTKYVGFADNLPMDDYYKFHHDVLKELLRVSDLVFYNIQLLTGNKPAILKLMGAFHENVKEIVIWDKGHAQPAIRDKVMNSQFEFIIIFQRSQPNARRFETGQFERGTITNIWEIKRGRKVNKDHGAAFPEALVEKIISNFTKKKSIVLDPFMGTGTTGVVARRLKRKFIGIEISKKYTEMAINRIMNIGTEDEKIKNPLS